MRADRLLSLLVLLQNHQRITAAELAERLAVSVRTIQRDVDVLSSAGVPVYAERGRGGGLRLHGQFTTRLTGLSRREAEALALVSAPSLITDLQLEREYASAVEKIAAAIPSVHQVRARHARQRLMFDMVPWFHDAPPDTSLKLLDTLRQAIWSDAVCYVHYARGDGVHRRYRIEPYALVAKVDLWYLVAGTGNGMRVFRVSRIHSLDVTETVFVREADFDLSRFWKRWCRRFEREPVARYWVTLELSAVGRDRLLDRYGGWHRTALAEWDESLPHNVVTLDLESEDTAARVVFELEGEGRVLKPQPLRALIRDRALAVAEASFLPGHTGNHR